MELIDMPVAAKFIVAFVLVLGLIGAGAFLWRRFGGGPLSTTGPRGRQPRLAVIDAAAVDARRRLVLIRRDNAEHLLMIGGPSDIVIESNIPRAAANPAVREPRPSPVADMTARLPPAIDGQGWSQPFETMPRVARPLEPPYPLAPAGEAWDGQRPEPPPRQPREPMPVEPAARTNRTEPSVRPPPVSAERFRSDFNDGEVAAPALTPPAMPPEQVFPEPRRAPVQPIPPLPTYEPAFQTAPAPERRQPAPTVPPAADEPALPREAEPRRAPVRAPPQAYEPVFQSAAAPEPQWAQASPTLASAQESGQQSGYHSPVFQSAVITESKRAQTVPPRPSQTDESNLAEMAQRLEAALRRPIKPVEPAPAPARAAAPGERVVNPGARAAAYFEPPAPPSKGPAARTQEGAPAPVLKVVPAPGKAQSLEEEMANLLGRSTGKT